jgi:hypothetical protein
MIIAAQIFFDNYNFTWPEVGESLLQMLDSSDLNARACAAYKIGKFSRDFRAESRPYEESVEYCYSAGKHELLSYTPSLTEVTMLINSPDRFYSDNVLLMDKKRFIA